MRAATFIVVVAMFATSFAFAAEDFFQPASLANKLPEKVVLVADGSQRGLAEAISKIRTVKPVAFLKLPDGHARPQAASQKKPSITDVRSARLKEADALILCFINEHGKVEGAYAAQYSDRQWAQTCAETVTQWTYRPFMVGNKASPVAIYIPFHYEDETQLD